MKTISYILLFNFIFYSSVYAKKNNSLISILENKTSKEVDSLFLSSKKLYGIKITTAEQKQFVNFFQKALYKKALYQWKGAFSKTQFVHSTNGKALFAYLLWKNKLFITGVKHLFLIKNPKKINKKLLELWKSELQNNMSSWVKVSKLNWNKQWTSVLSVQLKARYLAYNSYGLKSKQLYRLVKVVDLKSKEGIYLQWQLALALYLEGQSKSAAKVLSFLSKSNQKIIKEDLIFLTMARVLYGNNFLNVAIKYYKKVKKSSKFWFIAQEEIAWAYLRSRQLEKSLSILTTTTKSMFYYTSLSESLFLKSLVELKTCNYIAVSNTVTLFKKVMKKRIPALEEIKLRPNTPAIKNWLNAVNTQNRKDLIRLARKTPVIAPNDQRLRFLLQQKHAFFKESVLAKTFFKSSLSKGSGLGFQSFFKSLSNNLRKQSQSWKDLVFLEVKKLATEELATIKQQIAHIKVVELEMLQQVNVLVKAMHSNKSLANKQLTNQLKVLEKNKTLKAKNTSKRKKMYFSTNSEVWLDELNHYNVKLKNLCNASM
ncbi:MAG: hypothetical protein HAW63_03340 [Bdellovibrionaceae bacterium]|nr:hypothetical protein [Pseudobdellovibrionaceae bacterium]